jgi:uncharacterized protein (TIGR02594 family)
MFSTRVTGTCGSRSACAAGSALYHDVFSHHLRGPLDLAALQAELDALAQRHHRHDAAADRWPDLRPLPRMLQEARKLFGTREVAGSANNPVILGWAKEVGLAKSYTDDAVPWCGLFLAVVAKRAGKPLVEGPLWARSWVAFGNAADEAQLGDVLVFRRAESAGHVGLYVGEDSRVPGGPCGNRRHGRGISGFS